MDTASRVPVEPAFDKAQNAQINEGTTVPTTSNTTTSTTTTNATAAGAPAPAENAPGYLQQAREALVSLAGTAQNAIGIETPASTLHGLANNAKIDASLPTSEASGAAPGERTGGIGSLPGNASEEGVARLPAERTSVPSRELEGSYPGEKVGGVGALPGGLNESGVALLPDERASQANTGVDSSAKAAIASSTHPGVESSTHPGVGSSTHPGVESSTHPGVESSARPGVESSAHAAIHPKSENPDKTDLKTAAAHPVETAKLARRESSSSSSSSEGEATADKPRKKASLKNKIAGGVKLATGKIKKDEAMIAEGQALRGH